MSFFYSADAQSVVDALAAGDFDTVAMLMGDSQGELEDFLATQTYVTVTGTLDGAGDDTVAHGVDLTGASVLLAQGWWDNAGAATPLTVNFVDASTVSVSGGVPAAGSDYRVTLVVGVGLITF